MANASKITVDVPEGAEGLNVLWYVEPQGQIQFGGRMYVSKKINFKIISLPDPAVSSDVLLQRDA